MSNASTHKSSKIVRVSQLVSALAIWGSISALLITLLLMTLLLNEFYPLYSGLTPDLSVLDSIIDAPYNTLTPPDKMLLLGSLCFLSLLITCCFYNLFKLFRAFKNNGVFSQKATLSARNLAKLFSITFLCNLSLEWFIPVSANSDAIQAYSSNALFQDAILLGALWVGVWVLEYGRELLTENEMTI